MEHLTQKLEERRAFVRNNVTPVSDEDMLLDVNTDEVTRLAPVIVFLLIIFVTGIPGNGLVCYIYRTRYTMSSSRWFIFFLAAVDLIMCVIIVPTEIVTVFMQYTYADEFVCKLQTFCNTWSLLTLGITLVIVSIDRYRKVCTPLGWQINFDTARKLCIVAVAAAFVISLPILGIYGIYTFELPGYSVTGNECSFRKASEKSIFAMLYVLFGMVVFVVCLITICVLYMFIGKEIKNHIHKERLKRHISLSASMAMRHNYIEPVFTNELHQTSVAFNIDKRKVQFVSKPDRKPIGLHEDMIKVRKSMELNEDMAEGGNAVDLSDELPPVMKKGKFSDSTSVDTDEAETTVTMDGNSTNDHSDADTCDFEQSPKPASIRVKTKMGRSKTMRIRRTRTRKATFSMFLISLAFVLSYLPFLSLLLARSAVDNFDESLSDAGRAIYKFFLRSYFLNCAINPFIYGVSDSRFRGNCKDVVQYLHQYFRSLPGKLFRS